MSSDIERLATYFRALSDPNRLTVAILLTEGEHCVMDIATRLGVTHQVASYHIRQLQIAGLADRRRKGREIIYRLNSSASECLKAVSNLLPKTQSPS